MNNQKTTNRKSNDSEQMIVGRSFAEYCEEVERFHGFAAPGILIGGFMVDYAVDSIPEGILYEAISETRVCLPDAIQLLTPCTIGNSWLKIAHVGRFALALYNKYTGEGVRVFLDAKALDSWPEIKTWFLKLKPKAEQDSERLIFEIREAGHNLLGRQKILVKEDFRKKKKLGGVGLCSSCGEAYPLSVGNRCGGCRGELPYEPAP